MKPLLFALGIMIFFSACSSRPPAPAQSVTSQHSPIVKKLYAQYNSWRGTPYEYGGLSLDGVDCSGFIYKSYRSVFNITLPRSTKGQIKRGKRVYINELCAGDLIFFKTGYKTHHVGIYVENGKFMHASTSRGVTLSSMRDGYWREHYWQARRLL